jgi:5-formyltetrahydrofolate cyclo-ligase
LAANFFGAAARLFCLFAYRAVIGSPAQVCTFGSNSRWQLGAFNIPIPQHPEQCSAKDLDSVFVPLVGFDTTLARLGQGGGFYDTTFAFRRTRKSWLKPRLIGLAFACQQVDALPSEPWDLQLDAIATELAWLRRL